MRRYDLVERAPPPYDPQQEPPLLPTTSLQASLQLLVDGFMVFLQCAYALQHNDELAQRFGAFAPPVRSRIMLYRADSTAVRLLALLPPNPADPYTYYYTARSIEFGPNGRSHLAGAITKGPPSLELLESLVVSAGFTEQDVLSALDWMDRQTGRR